MTDTARDTLLQAYWFVTECLAECRAGRLDPSKLTMSPSVMRESLRLAINELIPESKL